MKGKLSNEIARKFREDPNSVNPQLTYIIINGRIGVSCAYRSYGVLGDGSEHFGFETFVWKHLQDGERELIAELGRCNPFDVAKRIVEEGEYREDEN